MFEQWSHRRRAITALITAAVAVVALAGCSKRNEVADPAAAGAPDMNVIVVSGPLDDPYFGAMKRGVDDAATQLNVTTEYLSPSSSKEGSGATLARLVQDAINKKPAAIVVANFFPDAENEVIKKAVDSGIPVVIHNTGDANWQELGALTYVGLEPGPVGSIAADQLYAQGSRKVLCVNPVPGNPFLEAACQGLADSMTGHSAESVPLSMPYSDSTNPTKVTQNIAGALRNDPSIDSVFVFGSAVAENAREAASQVDRPIKIGTGDLSTQVLKDIQEGTIAFALDSQPYLQSYYGVQVAVQYVRYGLKPEGVIATGPNIVTQDNVAKVLEINQATQGIRGAA